MTSLHYVASLRLGQKCFLDGEYVRAQRIGENLLAQNRKDLNALILLARCHQMQNHYEEAIKHYQKCIDLQPRNVEHHLNLGSLLASMGRYPQAFARFEKAAKVAPGDPRLTVAIADVHERAGDEAKAIEVLAPSIERGDEDVLSAYIYAKAKLAAKDPKEAVRVMMRHNREPSYPESYFFVLGKALEQTGDLDTAFKAYCTANEMDATKFDVDAHVKWVNETIDTYTRETLARLPKPTHDTSMPIFIVGRPRSGTTLLETILDAHPDVIGIGEEPMVADIADNLQFELGSLLPAPRCIRDMDQDDVNRLSRKYLDHARSLAKGRKHTVDKSIANYSHLGLIKALWPQAKIIDCRRDPVDNCWACFVVRLIFHAYASDLTHLGVSHRWYERIMRHWHETLDLPILEVRYEDMVADQAAWTRRILDFCGLPWDEKTLRFYEEGGQQRSNAVALTLSYDQVRQPIYKTSVGRARKFEKHLGPLFEGFEIGRRQIEESDQARAAAKSRAASPPPAA